MSPEEALLRRLRAEIGRELQGLTGLLEESDGAPSGDDPYTLRARGSILHDFYGRVEGIFERIADELDGGRPQGARWHRQLLDSMTLEIPSVRPAVITPELAGRLREFLAFRRRFRNLYGFDLYGERLTPLEARMGEVLDLFEAQVRTFLDWLTEPA